MYTKLMTKIFVLTILCNHIYSDDTIPVSTTTTNSVAVTPATTPATTTPTPVATTPSTDASSTTPPTNPTTTTTSTAATTPTATSTTTTTPTASTNAASTAITPPTPKEQPKQIVVSVYIQNNYNQPGTLQSIELLFSNQSTPISKDLNIPIKAANLYSKGAITAFDVTTNASDLQTFNGITSITIDGTKLTFNNAKASSTIYNPIKITQENVKWVLTH